LRGVASGQGDGLVIDATGSPRLANLFESAARRMGLGARLTGDPPELSRIFEQGSPNESGEEAPRVEMHWQGWEALSMLPGDSIDAISVDNLERAGRSLSLALMIAGRELDY
jgi:hypothetical protein